MTHERENRETSEELFHSLSKLEERMEELSRKHLKADYELFKGFEDLYEKIEKGEGIPCDRCCISVTAENYGGVIVTHSSKKSLKVICRYCRIPYFGFYC